MYKAFAITLWIGGIILAKGFWSTLAAVIVPFWSWYLVIERLFTKFAI